MLPSALLAAVYFWAYCWRMVLGSQIKDVRLADRYVTVRGLAERTVQVDVAIWPLSFREAGTIRQASQGLFSISSADAASKGG